MRDLGIQVLTIEGIAYDKEDIARRMALPHVKELAESRGRIALHPVTVDGRRRELVAGRDRLAADLLRGKTTIVATIVEGTREEMQDIEDEENVRRRHGDRDEILARMTKRRASDTTQRINAQVERKLPGRPKSAAGKAREEVAKKAGTTPEAVRHAERRAAETKAPTVAPPIALNGKPADAAWLEQVRQVQEAVDAADRAGRAMHAALTRLEALPFPGGALQRFKRAAHHLAAEVRAMRPRKICETGPCHDCDETGWLAEDLESPETEPRALSAPAAVGESVQAPSQDKGVNPGSSVVSTGAGPVVERPGPAPRKLKVSLVDLSGEEIPFKEGAPLPAPEDLPEEDGDAF